MLSMLNAGVVTVTTLTRQEAGNLSSYEHVISSGLQGFIDVGKALVSIRDERLYRADYDTFESYCEERWGLRRPRAYELMAAAVSVSEISNIDGMRESHAAALSKVPNETRQQVWDEVNERTGGKPTARDIRAVVADDPPGSATKASTHRRRRKPMGEMVNDVERDLIAVHRKLDKVVNDDRFPACHDRLGALRNNLLNALDLIERAAARQ